MATYDKNKKYISFRPTNVRESIAFVVEPVADSVATVATHQLYTIPVGYAVVGGFVAIQTTLTSTSSTGTLKFSIGDDLTSAITMNGTGLAAGDILSLDFGMSASSAEKSTYAVSAVDTFDMVIATNAITAGKFVVVLDLAHISGIL